MKGIRHRIVSSATARPATQYAPDRQVQAPEETESLNRNKPVLRARGDKPTRCGKQRRYGKTVKLDQEQQDSLGDSCDFRPHVHNRKLTLIRFHDLLARRKQFAVFNARGFPVRHEDDIQPRPRTAKVVAHGSQSALCRVAPNRIAVLLARYKSNTAARAVLGISPVHDNRCAGSCMSFSVREQVGDLSAGFDGS